MFSYKNLTANAIKSYTVINKQVFQVIVDMIKWFQPLTYLSDH